MGIGRVGLAHDDAERTVAMTIHVAEIRVNSGYSTMTLKVIRCQLGVGWA